MTMAYRVFQWNPFRLLDAESCDTGANQGILATIQRCRGGILTVTRPASMAAMTVHDATSILTIINAITMPKPTMLSS